MRDLAPYLYPLIFAALVLLNYVMQRIAKWQKEQSAAKEESKPQQDDVQKSLEELKRRREQLEQKRSQLQRPGEQTVPRAEQPAPRPERPAERARRERVVRDEPLEVRQARARASRPETPAPPATRATRVSGVRVLLADQRSLRQAIVLMTVLGPCRAQQPPAAGGRGTLHDE